MSTNTYSADLSGDLEVERLDGRWTTKASSLVGPTTATDVDHFQVEFDAFNWDNYVKVIDTPERARFENVVDSEYGQYGLREQVQYEARIINNMSASRSVALAERPEDLRGLICTSAMNIPLVSVNTSLGTRAIGIASTQYVMRIHIDPRFSNPDVVKYVLNRSMGSILYGPYSGLVFDALTRQEELRNSILVPRAYNT